MSNNKPFDIKKVDFSGLGQTLLRAQLEMCVAADKGHGDCVCTTVQEHATNIQTAKELGLTAR